MTDESLYREAADLIKNEKTQQIIDLLTEYDAQWDGWATLMGQTAGEIIAKEVALAIANYKDVKDGTITENGGTNTNKVNGVTSSTSSSSTSTGSSTASSSSSTRYHTIKSGDTLWDLAVKYYGDGNQWTKIQKANGGIDPYALAIGKKLIIPFFTGGYTGTNEGLAYLHKKERVLNAQQTSAFESLVYDFLPIIQKGLLNNGSNNNTFNNGGNVTFNKPLVSVNIDKINQNKDFDVNNGIDNLGRMLDNSLKKSGINLGKK
jgi:LysM repeat protein